MQKILVPVDFSDQTKPVVEEAIRIANRFRARLFLVHIYSAMKRADTILSVNKLLARQADEKFEALMSDIERRYDADLVCKSIKGRDVSTTLDQIAHQIGIDLIIIGSKGEMNDPRIFLGGVTGRLLKRTNIPLLILPEQGVLGQINNILLARKSPQINNPDILRPLRDFSETYQAPVHLLKVKVPQTEPALAMAGDDHHSAGEFSHRHTIDADNMYNGIEQFLDESHYDMLCVVRRKRGFFELLFRPSAIKKSAFNIQQPMLVLQGEH